MTKKKFKLKIHWQFIVSLVLIVVIAGYAFNSYISKIYYATNDAKKALISDEFVAVETIPDSDRTIVFKPNQIKAGIIFYPGGKVEYKAYAPLLHALADNGYLCILLHMTNNLAIFEPNAASGLKEMYPEVDTWYMAGHSLGGAMAASYLSENTDSYDGLLLFASFSNKDLSATDLTVLSIYGSNDEVLSKSKYEKNKANLPANVKEYVVEGGCHSYFGMYGLQSGDGNPSISNAEQIQSTVDYVVDGLEN